MPEKDRSASSLEFVETLYRLKSIRRTGWVKAGVESPESIADHVFGTALLCFFLCSPRLEREKCISMALCHDLAESLVGDITPHDGISPEKKKRLEVEALSKLSSMAAVAGVNDGTRMAETRALWHEFEDGLTPEAVFVRQADVLDRCIQALIYLRDRENDGKKLTDFFHDLKSITEPELAPIAKQIESEVGTRNRVHLKAAAEPS